jgi:hypothetical protein
MLIMAMKVGLLRIPVVRVVRVVTVVAYFGIHHAAHKATVAKQQRVSDWDFELALKA